MGIEFLMWPLLLAGLMGYDLLSSKDDEEDGTDDDPADDPDSGYLANGDTGGVKSQTGDPDIAALYRAGDYSRSITGGAEDDSLAPDGTETDLAFFGGAGDDSITGSTDDDWAQGGAATRAMTRSRAEKMRMSLQVVLMPMR